MIHVFGMTENDKLINVMSYGKAERNSIDLEDT
jgi:hypothetical protein